MLQSKINRLGSARQDLLQNHLLPPLLNSMNACVTTDEKSSLSESMNKAPFQVVTVVDPAIVSTVGQGDLLSSALWRRQNMPLRRTSSLSESVFLRTPKGPSLSSSSRQHTNASKRVLHSTSVRKCPSDLPSFKKRIERLRASSKESRKASGKHSFIKTKKKKGGDRGEDLVDKLSPAIPRNLIVEGGFAAKLSMVKEREKELNREVKKVKKKKKKPPPKFKANLRDFKQRINIEGTEYVMEMYLAPDVIEKTRKNNIDYTKQPKLVVNFSKAADMRDEFSNYCGQRKSLKNWLYYV